MTCTLTNQATNDLILIIDNDCEQSGAARGLFGLSGNKLAYADALQEYFEDLLDDPRPEGGTDFERLVILQFVSSMLNAVDWVKVAEHYMEKIAEGA